MESQKFDSIIIGSGLGSLSFAAIRASQGRKVLVLEKAKEPGGCASSYTKDGYRFEAGATTLVGLEPKLPIHELFSNLKLDISSLPLRSLDPAMKVYLSGDAKPILTRNSNRANFITDCCEIFGESKKQNRFWKLIFFLSDHVWSLSARLIHFPPRSISDLFRIVIAIRFKDIFLLGFSFISMRTLLGLPGFPKSKSFKKFLDEQLLITVQTTSDTAPVSMGAAGITYAHLESFYLDNGIGSLAHLLVKYIRSHAGEVHLLEEVQSIDIGQSIQTSISRNIFLKSKIIYNVLTRRNQNYTSSEIVCGIPIWNIEKLLDHPSLSVNHSAQKIVSKLKTEVVKRSLLFSKGIWGAFNIAMVVEDFLEDETNIHFQFHLDERLPFGCGDSIFISVSHINDNTRCPSGQRVLAISTHIENPNLWSRKDEDYKDRKQEISDKIISFLEARFPGFDRDKIVYMNSATPASWATWTGRYQGRVGGIPASYFFNPFRYPSSFLKSSPGFYLLGDTVYPGQGIPAVVLGALNLSKRLS